MTFQYLLRSATLRSITVAQRRAISGSRITLAKSEVGQIISDVAQQEGGTAKGSKSAQLQSEVTKQRNEQQGGQTNNSQPNQSIMSKVSNSPASVTADDAQQLHGAASRANGGQQPPSGSLASQTQSLAAKNEQGGSTSASSQASQGQSDPTAQSRLDRQKNYEEAADVVKQKLQQDPATVTKEDGDIMHSREQKAFGTTAKGGLASQAQTQAAKNE